MSKESEKKVFLDIDKEITKKKQDRATLTKAKALAKNKDVESKYIELRFEEIWEEIVEEKLKPTIGLAMQKILMAQSIYEKENQPKPIGGDSLFGDGNSKEYKTVFEELKKKEQFDHSIEAVKKLHQKKSSKKLID